MLRKACPPTDKHHDGCIGARETLNDVGINTTAVARPVLRGMGQYVCRRKLVTLERVQLLTEKDIVLVLVAKEEPATDPLHIGVPRKQLGDNGHHRRDARAPGDETQRLELADVDGKRTDGTGTQHRVAASERCQVA